MIYTKFKNLQISKLAFGTMRLPQNTDGSIDTNEFREMVDYAIKNGVNYFDTAYPYHNGLSEIELGKALKKYKRESFFIATKFPGHQISQTYDPQKIFEEQLKKCGVEYFDFYLLHNVYEQSINVYLDPKWKIIEYFKKQKKLGRIKYLGFSTHARIETLKTFLDKVNNEMDFCQIQLNYIDWSLQKAQEKVKLLNERNIPIWVMEPLRGGKLCNLSDELQKEIKQIRSDETVTSMAFRFLESIEGVNVILSGMSNLDQMKDNIETFKVSHPLNKEEFEQVLKLSDQMKNNIPCTACKYCLKECPMGLDIPMLIETYNELEYQALVNSIMRIEILPLDKQPSACLACGKCQKICPQNIEIPKVLEKLSNKIKEMPKWKDICLERELQALALKKGETHDI